jgi:hypothetical protein
MGIVGFIEALFRLVAPPKPMKLNGTTKATLAYSLSALPPDERGWITFAEARTCSRPRRYNTRSEKRIRSAEETSSHSLRSTGPSSTSCRSRAGCISYAIRRCDEPCLVISPPEDRGLYG